MTTETWDIDRLVREVVQRLTETRTPGAAPAATSGGVLSQAKTNVATAAVATPATEWHLPARLVTLDTLAGRPASAKVLTVARGTVVTPAARDQLRQWRIDLKFVDAKATSPSPASAPGVGKLYLHAATGVGIRGGGNSAALARSLANLPWSLETLVAAPLPQAVAELAAVLTEPRRVGVLLTSDRELATCLANRWSNVRAIAANEKEAIKSCVRDWGANLLVLDPRPVSAPTLRSLVEAFVASGPRCCPADWKQYLEK